MSNPFGSDLILQNGDIIFTNNGDLFTTQNYEDKNQATSRFEGYYNILFALTNAILTKQGSYTFHPEYGGNFVSLISDANSSQLKENMEQEVRETLSKDPRVQDVSNVIIQQDGNKISVTIYATMIGQQQSSEFVFPNFVIE